MKLSRFRFPIGMRTVKTVASVVISMFIVDAFGMTDSRLIFAMLGATAAMQPTFRESLSSSMEQITGVLFGAIAGLFLRHLPTPMLFNTGLGIALCIVLYNALRFRFSPSMPIFMVVLLCTTPDIEAFPYAFGRIWDSAIGLGVGMLINTLIFPYDNSRQIRAAVKSLDRELIAFLEELFDGDDVQPDAKRACAMAEDIERQLMIFSKQRLVLSRRRQAKELASFTRCSEKAELLLSHLSVLHHIGKPGCLSPDNQRRLAEHGAHIGVSEAPECDLELNLVTNYHVAQVLTLRQELLDALEN
ncbi:MAG: FUSC family protein [Clostridia bacterium]|nr:FUSC family protein [Clostridia bacterium]